MITSEILSKDDLLKYIYIEINTFDLKVDLPRSFMLMEGIEIK